MTELTLPAVDTITFVETAADPNKGFRIGREPSLFVNGVTYTITGKKFGNYKLADGSETRYASTSQSIVLTTSIGEDLPLKRLLTGKRVYLDAEGKAHIQRVCAFHDELTAHMEKLGRNSHDAAYYSCNVESVANHAFEFFNGKTFIVETIDDVFAKDNKTGKLVAATPVVVHKISE